MATGLVHQWARPAQRGRSGAQPRLDPPQPLRIAGLAVGAAKRDTESRKSRRALALPARCADALWQQFEDQGGGRH